jgi:hypothetical protein
VTTVSMREHAADETNGSLLDVVMMGINRKCAIYMGPIFSKRGLAV